ncbi:MAG TPA: helix-turn-helix domain-containing protein [Bryobacteraceae bacterium]|nr:helix-turn-helix domain-containing protein [Bryobacteraceae bacterium]
MPGAVARYREFAPCASLREHVRAFFSFVDPHHNQDSPSRPVMREVIFQAGDCFCSPLFADGHASLVFSFEKACQLDGRWKRAAAGPSADVIGPMTAVGAASLGERAEMFGVYFRAAQDTQFLTVPTRELTDRVAALRDLWGRAGLELLGRLGEAAGESARIACLESVLERRIGAVSALPSSLDLPAMTSHVIRSQGGATVQGLADAAGVSRQHLTRVFRESVGLTPKLYCRLARFQAALRYAGRGDRVNWAQAALEMGYADQSHMIAEFRQFSSLTPQALARKRWFHPFIERAHTGVPDLLVGETADVSRDTTISQLVSRVPPPMLNT